MSAEGRDQTHCTRQLMVLMTSFLHLLATGWVSAALYAGTAKRLKGGLKRTHLMMTILTLSQEAALSITMDSEGLHTYIMCTNHLDKEQYTMPGHVNIPFHENRYRARSTTWIPQPRMHRSSVFWWFFYKYTVQLSVTILQSGSPFATVTMTMTSFHVRWAWLEGYQLCDRHLIHKMLKHTVESLSMAI